ncbi:karyopherin [Friedmanniomyces endolithicus]|nr:karyopherin [Friedmanniomyces endolithicus]
MRDTRCCTIICKAFRTIIPLFQQPANAKSPSSTHSSDNAAQVREFISTAVLQSCITSLHDPYFAEMQKDLASLIAQIILLYSPSTDTPREVLCSLPDMTVARVEKAFGRIAKAGGSERVLRAVVLELLEGVRGVGIYEAGRIGVGAGVSGGGGEAGKRGVRREYMEVEAGPARVGEGEEVGLEGVAGLFGEV